MSAGTISEDSVPQGLLKQKYRRDEEFDIENGLTARSILLHL